jgi:hypothetical protein
MTIVFSTGGYAFVIEYSTTVGCDSLNVPACPTASGAADAQSSKLDRVRVDVRKDGRLVSSQRTSVRRQTNTHGQTVGDAKLDFVDVDDVVAMSTTAGGVSLNGTLTRHTHISMRTEQYDPSQSTASFVGAEALQRTDNGSFAGLARSTIGVYRSAESAPDTLGLGGGWSVFDQRNSGSYCINLKFNPERRTIKVKKGKSGTFTGQAIAKSDGGVATESRWERTAQYNGTFSPERTSGNSVTINYTVTAAPPGELVVSEYKVTSTAGVVQGSWAQDTEPTTINHIAGSFNGTQTLVGGTAGNAVMAFTGTMVYDRFGASPFGGADGRFQFASGEYTLVASGLDQSGVTLCRQTGSKRFTIPPNSGSMQVDGTGPNREAPYTYQVQAIQPAQTMTITRTSCPPNTDPPVGNGTTFQSGLFTPFQTSRTHTSSDGISFADSEDQRTSGSGMQWSWSLQGTEE